MSKHCCPGCGHQFEHRSVGARLVLATTGAILGKSHPLVAVAAGIFGIVIGREVDRIIEEQLDPVCPQCGFVIRALATTL